MKAIFHDLVGVFQLLWTYHWCVRNHFQPPNPRLRKHGFSIRDYACDIIAYIQQSIFVEPSFTFVPPEHALLSEH